MKAVSSSSFGVFLRLACFFVRPCAWGIFLVFVGKLASLFFGGGAARRRIHKWPWESVGKGKDWVSRKLGSSSPAFRTPFMARFKLFVNKIDLNNFF